MARVIAGVVDDVVALGAPRACAGCGMPGRALCVPCEALVIGAPRWHRPTPTPDQWIPTQVVADYNGIARAAITAWKEAGRRDVAAHLARALAVALDASASALPPGSITIVPIPASASALRRRGEDAWDRVVRRAVDQMPTPAGGVCIARCLHHVRKPKDQSGLSATDRRLNLAGALTCAPAPPGPVILVDDIVTTGATLAEAARALRAAGVLHISGAAIAATSRDRR